MPAIRTKGLSGRLLEAVSKPQIASKDKARIDEKAQSRRGRHEPYISKKLATPYLGVKWDFETTSNDLGGFEHIRKVRILKAFYRNPYPGVKPHYPCFSDLSIKVINRLYPDEFIADNMQFDLMALKPTVSPPRDYSLRF